MDVPAVSPFTIPVLPIVATEPMVLLHVPLPAMSARIVDDPAQTLVAPVMLPASGIGFTVNIVVATARPQLFVTE